MIKKRPTQPYLPFVTEVAETREFDEAVHLIEDGFVIMGLASDADGVIYGLGKIDPYRFHREIKDA